MDYEASNRRELSDDNGLPADSSTAGLTPQVIAAAAAAGAIPLNAGADGVIVLPAGVELDDILVRGRDLVIQTDDGRTYVIVDGAIFVPTLVIDGVSVPPLNLAALLNGAEIQPAAGTTQSSGNNFSVPVGDIQDAYRLGDLLPYTEFGRGLETPEEIIPGLVDREPDVLIEDGSPPSKNAVDSVSEAGLPGTRLNGNVESPGSASAGDSEITTGRIIVTSPDGIASVTINGTTINLAGGTSITTPLGRLDLGALVGEEIGYTYTLIDNLTDNSITDVFTVVVTDPDGDSSTATLTVSIVDDAPDAINDVDSVASGSNGPATGNVITGVEVAVAEDANATDGVADVQGADGARVSFIDNSQNAAPGVAVPAGGSVNIAGQYGTLTIYANGDYSYARAPGQGGGQTEVFTYTLLDGDTVGDTDTATLTISIGDSTPTISGLTPQADGGDTVVDEDDLPSGSDTTKESLTGTGDFTITSPDGVASLVIGGHQVITNGVFTADSWTTPLGNTISILTYNPATGVVTYSYTLGAAETHADAGGENNLFENFAVSMTDLDGDPASSTLSVRIVDDVPTGVNDTDSVAAGSTDPATGNVLTGTEVTVAEDGNATDGVADVQGADGARVSFIDNAQNAAAGVAVPANGSVNIAGQYGTLTIFANGDYSYARTPGTPGGNDEVFTYTLLDGDGDTDTATLTISIGNAPPVISGLVPEAQGGDVVVDEDDLADGSDPAPKNSLTDTDTFTISSPDGVASLVVGGHQVITNGVFTADSWTTPLGNTISITGYNSVTGVVTYSYTLGDNENHPNANGENSLFENFDVVLTDLDGQSDSDILSAQIVDDVPTGIDDTDSVAAGSTDPATGNVLTGTEVTVAEDGNATDGVADVQGADGARVSFIDNAQNAAAGVAVPANGSVNIAGQYGTLTIFANGDYSYARTPGTPGGNDEVFTYTLLDGDGDTDTATLTISIGNAPPVISGLVPEAQGGDVVVDEDDLADGSDPAPKNSLTDTDTFTISSPDGVASLVVGGHQVITNGVFTADSWTTPLGNTISITGYNSVTGVVTYSYTLGDNENHPNANGENSLFENFDVVLTDLDGQSDSDILSAQIVDDVPTGIDDTDSVAAGSTDPATGNVLTGTEVTVAEDGNATDGVADVQGADGARVSFIDNAQNAAAGVAVPANGSVNIAGQYGTLTIFANGDYSYARTPGTPGGNDEVFTYTLLDGDGDTDTATLTISIGNAPPVISGLVPEAQGGDVVVDEDDLADGSDPAPKNSLTDTDTFTISSPDGVASLVVGGHQVITNGVFTADSWTTPLGNTISITGYNSVTGVVTYSYTLGDNENHPNANGENSLFENFDVVLTDLDGQSDSDILSAQIVDDVPTATDDGVPTPYSVAENTPLVIDVLANDTTGADWVNDTVGMQSFTQPPVGEGTVAYNNDGTFTFTPPAAGTFFGATSFTYTIIDGDGDPSTATVYVNVARDSTPNILRVDTVTVDEDGFGNANDDGAPLQGSPQEVDSNELLVNTGTIIINFGADVPANPLAFANMHLVDTAGLDTQLQTLDGNPVTFALVGNDLVGSGTGGEVIRIALTSYVLGPNPGDVSYTYTVTLTQPVEHPTVGTEDTELLSGVTFAGQDSDGSPFQGTLSVNIIDDVPSLSVSDTPSTVVEGQLLNTGTWTRNPGADADGAVIKVVVNAVEYDLDTNIDTGLGTLRVNSGGTWTFQAAGNVDNDPTDPTVTFTVKVTDGDLDVAQDTQVISITDGTGPSATKNATINVDEEGLDTANATGTNPVAPSENGSDTVTFQAGSDNIVSVAFESPLAGLTVDVNGLPGPDIVWFRDSDTVIRGEIGGITAITITLTPTVPIAAGNSGNATVSVVIADNFPHIDALGENNIAITGLSVVATDTDGTSAAAGVTINVKDDVPTLSVSDTPDSVVEGQLLNTGTWTRDPGADADGAVIKVVVGAVEYDLDTNIDTGVGTLRVNSNGTWTFQAAGNVDNDPNPTVTFTVRIVDGDGDPASDQQTITITDGAGPSATKNATINVDEEGLDTANATGTNPVAPSENGSDTVTFQAGSDNIVSVAFESPLAGLTVDVNGLPGPDIVWFRDSDTVIRGEIGGITAITITLTPTVPIAAGNSGNATVSVVIADNFPHIDALGENNIAITGLSVVATDTDGTTAAAGVTINVKDDVPVNNDDLLSAAVHEDALNNPPDDVGNNELNKTVNASFTAAAIAALVIAGADSPVAIALNDTSLDGTDTGLFQGGTKIVWEYVDADQVRGVVDGTSDVVFTLTWNAGTQSYDFVLLDNIDNDDDGNLATGEGEPHTETLSLANVFTATDTDGDMIVIDQGPSLTIENDAPLPYTTPPAAVVATNTGEDYTTTPLSLNLPAIGADGPGVLAFTTTSGTVTGFIGGSATPSNLQANGSTLTWALKPGDATILQAKTAGGVVAFEIDLNPANGTYTFSQFEQITATQNVDILDLTSVGGGNNETKAINTASIYDVVVSTAPGDTVNTNSTEMGIGNGQSLSGSDVLRIDFVTIDSVSGGGNPTATFGEYYSANSYKQNVSGVGNDNGTGGPQRADFTVHAIAVKDAGGNSPPTTPTTDGDNVFYGDANDVRLTNTTLNIYNSVNGSSTNGTLVASYDLTGALTFSTAAYLTSGIVVTQLSDGWQIDNLPNNYDYEILSATAFQAVEVNALATTSTFKLGFVDLNVLTIEGVSFSVPISWTDSDGDQVTSSIAINLAAPPIVFDLDGDGAEFLSLDAGVTFAYNGVPVATAWAAPDDGLLAIDTNSNGRVDDASELVYGGPGITDLQGLAANYDSNQDGKLDAQDADFAKFGIWQDANSNGVTDDGEFHSLADLGIASLALTSDGVAYTAADGDVTVHGTTTYTRTDGTTGTAADATFAVGDAEVMDALLSANAPTAGEETDLTAVQGALAATVDTLTVDTLVDHFAANDDASQPTSEPDDGDLMALLNASIDSTVEASAPPMAMESYDESAALAAAAA